LATFEGWFLRICLKANISVYDMLWHHGRCIDSIVVLIVVEIPASYQSEYFFETSETSESVYRKFCTFRCRRPHTAE
jgi:hypothetical protein